MTYNETAGWDQTKQNDVLTSLAAQGYNAFGIFGVSPDNINSTFEDLKRKGYVVGSLASCPAGDVNKADFVSRPTSSRRPTRRPRRRSSAMGGQGNLVHLTGNKVDSNTQRRMAGVDKAVDEAGGKVTLLQVVTDIDKDLQTAQKAVADLLAAKGSQINGIVTTAYNPAVAAAGGVRPVRPADQGHRDRRRPDHPVSAIKAGWVSGTVVQNPVGQAYVGSYAKSRWRGCTRKTLGLVVDLGSFVVTQDKVDTHDQDRQAKTAELKSAFDSQYLSHGYAELGGGPGDRTPPAHGAGLADGGLGQPEQS